MELDKVIKTIKKCFKKPKRYIVLSKHFQDQCKERDLNIRDILNFCKRGEIVGAIKQDENLFKVVFRYTSQKDLIIAMTIVKKDKIKLTTAFPQDSERRTRK